jgi:hypothetical protein
MFGFLSLIHSLLFVGPHLPGFFPKVAALYYLRNIEYMGIVNGVFNLFLCRKNPRPNTKYEKETRKSSNRISTHVPTISNNGLLGKRGINTTKKIPNRNKKFSRQY